MPLEAFSSHHAKKELADRQEAYRAEATSPDRLAAISDDGVTTHRKSEDRQRLRAERSRRALAAVGGLAREHGPRVEEPTVLNDLVSLMVHRGLG